MKITQTLKMHVKPEELRKVLITAIKQTGCTLADDQGSEIGQILISGSDECIEIKKDDEIICDLIIPQN